MSARPRGAAGMSIDQLVAEVKGAIDAESSANVEGGLSVVFVEPKCETSADCEAQASAQASANVECTPPQLDIRFELAAGVDADARAEFIAKMSELKVRMVAIIQGLFQMRALIDADYAAEIGIDPPVVQIAAAVEGLMDMNLDELDIPVGRYPCVLPALEDSADILATAGTDLVVTLQAQLEIVGVLGIM